tara:strand:+ start:2187 stop:3605 length:1419 start_codon:yes stop_codon:yes gene_type:complete
MANFDIEGAKKAGYSDAEIADHLAQQSKFDVVGARKAGYSDAEIIQHVAPKKISWGDVPLEALKNIPKSTGNFFGGIYQAAKHPIDSLENVADLMVGGVYNALPKPLQRGLDAIEFNPEAQQAAIGKADKVGQMYKDRYGSMEGVKNTLATDPVGVASDVSTVLGVGAGVTGGKLSANLSKASNLTNPLSAVAPIVRGVSNVTNPMRTAMAESLMQSALKPTIGQLKSGDAAIASKTLLENGINATKGGVDKLKGLVGDTNENIVNAISASTATVDKNQVIAALADVKNKFGKQVSPVSDLNAIDSVQSGFQAHPMLQGNSIPVQLAQQLKQGTYSVLAKKYGQLGSAETEAQKALARGLKEGIAEAVPEVAALNAKESALIKTLGVTERRALMDMNKNPMGLSLLANNPATWAAFMADKSALFKSLAARLVNPGAPSKMVQAVKDAGGATGITSEQAKLAALLASQAGNQQ